MEALLAAWSCANTEHGTIGDDSFCSTSISGILKEANALMGLETEGTLPDQAAKLSAELGI